MLGQCWCSWVVIRRLISLSHWQMTHILKPSQYVFLDRNFESFSSMRKAWNTPTRWPARRLTRRLEQCCLNCGSVSHSMAHNSKNIVPNVAWDVTRHVAPAIASILNSCWKWLNFTHFGTEGETIATFRSAFSRSWSRNYQGGWFYINHGTMNNIISINSCCLN